ncbi:MAG TPA: hypothetical protein VMT15_17015 [Bryobacteraceae bacterium]|nr:hypothetical protein [Bryobacteraceae bacterium]
MKKVTRYFACLGIMVVAGIPAAAQTATAEQTREANLQAYISMLRKDVKADKVSILTELMVLSPEEAAKFWPVYNEYDKALTKLADERIVFIRMYADSYASMTSEKATKIAMGLMDLEAKRVELRRQYFIRLSKTLTPIDAARWLQVESQLEKLLDLQILANLPIVE